MRIPVPLLLAAMLSIAPPMAMTAAAPGDEAPKASTTDDRARTLAHLAKAIGGEWVAGDAATEDPTSNPAWTSLEQGFVNGVLRERTWFVENGVVVPYYDGIYFWNPRSKQCEYVMVASSGRTIKGTVALEGETEVSYFTESGDDGEWTYRHHLRYLDDATQEKKIEEKKNGAWGEVATLRFHRVTTKGK